MIPCISAGGIERISGKDYDVFIKKFVAAVKKLFPQVFLHWEDFGSYNSYNNLAQLSI